MKQIVYMNLVMFLVSFILTTHSDAQNSYQQFYLKRESFEDNLSELRNEFGNKKIYSRGDRSGMSCRFVVLPGIKEYGYRIQIWQFEFYNDIKTQIQIHFKRQDTTSIRHYHSKAGIVKK